MRMDGAVKSGIYQGFAPMRSGRTSYPDHIVNVDGQDRIIPNGSVGKGSPSGGRKKTRGTRKSRKSRRATRKTK